MKKLRRFSKKILKPSGSELSVGYSPVTELYTVRLATRDNVLVPRVFYANGKTRRDAMKLLRREMLEEANPKLRKVRHRLQRVIGAELE